MGIVTSGTKCQLKFSQKFQVLWNFFTKATQLYCNGCAIPECKAQRLEGTSTPQQTWHPGILCYRSKGSNHCPGQNTRAPPGSPKIATWHICQEICLLAKTQWLNLLNLADAGREDVALKRADLYSVMRPQHKAFYKTAFQRQHFWQPKKEW